MTSTPVTPRRPAMFGARTSVPEVEEGCVLAPRFDLDGLISVVATDASSGEVLMMGVMNAEALQRSIVTQEAHYWSRSRRTLWHKGATSGLIQRIVEMRIDDDQDAVWLRVSVIGGANCHVGYRSCFYRAVALGDVEASPASLTFKEDRKVFDPVEIYGDAPNPTQL